MENPEAKFATAPNNLSTTIPSLADTLKEMEEEALSNGTKAVQIKQNPPNETGDVQGEVSLKKPNSEIPANKKDQKEGEKKPDEKPFVVSPPKKEKESFEFDEMFEKTHFSDDDRKQKQTRPKSKDHLKKKEKAKEKKDDRKEVEINKIEISDKKLEHPKEVKEELAKFCHKFGFTKLPEYEDRLLQQLASREYLTSSEIYFYVFGMRTERNYSMTTNLNEATTAISTEIKKVTRIVSQLEELRLKTESQARKHQAEIIAGVKNLIQDFQSKKDEEEESEDSESSESEDYDELNEERLKEEAKKAVAEKPRKGKSLLSYTEAKSYDPQLDKKPNFMELRDKFFKVAKLKSEIATHKVYPTFIQKIGKGVLLAAYHDVLSPDCVAQVKEVLKESLNELNATTSA